MELQVAVAKVSKWANRESGDTLEMIERPHGGLSFVLVDGQHSGSGAKTISNLVARKALTLLAEGVRDGAAARAAHDYLYALRQGKVSATLNIVSVDLDTRTLVLSRNNPAPMVVLGPGGVAVLAEDSHPVGIHKRTKPLITELPLDINTAVVLFTDGLCNAGARRGLSLDVAAAVTQRLSHEPLDAQAWADGLLAEALALDEGRPADDISVLVLAVVPRSGDPARRLVVKAPLA
jgi:serine phosphatase RsbU (regulator of sigma subunit)